MKVSLKTITPNAEVNIVEIARVSSSREDKTEAPEGLINYLIRNKHWSPFQHSYLTFEIETSKAIAIQYLRHLSFTFQEFSQRYATADGIEPVEFRLQADKNRQSSTELIGIVWQDEETAFNAEIHKPEFKLWLEEVTMLFHKTFQLYNEGLALGVARETARMILPMATKTTLYMTGSIRSWIHLLEIRDDSHAQKEAQLIAKEIKKLFIKELPIISKALNYT
jgi:thymidylate synthase (FAD)